MPERTVKVRSRKSPFSVSQEENSLRQLFELPVGNLYLADIHVEHIRNGRTVRIDLRCHHAFYILIGDASILRECDLARRHLRPGVRGRSGLVGGESHDLHPIRIATAVIGSRIACVNVHRLDFLTALTASLVPVVDGHALLGSAEVDIPDGSRAVPFGRTPIVASVRFVPVIEVVLPECLAPAGIASIGRRPEIVVSRSGCTADRKGCSDPSTACQG